MDHCPTISKAPKQFIEYSNSKGCVLFISFERPGEALPNKFDNSKAIYRVFE
jgi:hypothetical protein